jgi:hypothetical protein
MTEILLKVVLNTINQTKPEKSTSVCIIHLHERAFFQVTNFGDYTEQDLRMFYFNTFWS